jgi:uncharacterized coiled-coil protein SlyX
MKGRNPDDNLTGSGLSGIRATDEPDSLSTRDAGHEGLRGRDSGIHTPMRLEARESGNGALWALCGALTLALVGFGYWSHQQQSRLQQQLIATQNSFARISEEAAGRIQDITGKVSATESTLSVAEAARQSRLDAIQVQLEELDKRLALQNNAISAASSAREDFSVQLATQQADQQTLTTQTLEIAELVTAQAGRITAAEAAATDNTARLQGLVGDLANLSKSVAQMGELEERLAAQNQTIAGLTREVTALAQAGGGVNLEQELLILRTEMEERQNYAEETLRSIDAFRAQVNRTIVTLKSQIANLQQQLAGS